jgi:hypothetical protein
MRTQARGDDENAGAGDGEATINGRGVDWTERLTQGRATWIGDGGPRPGPDRPIPPATSATHALATIGRPDSRAAGQVAA